MTPIPATDIQTGDSAALRQSSLMESIGLCLSKGIFFFFLQRAAGENDDRLLPPFLPQDGDRKEKE